MLKKMGARTKTKKNFKRRQKGGKITIKQWSEKGPFSDEKPRLYHTMDNNRKIYEIYDDFYGTGYKDVYKLNMDANGRVSRGKRVLRIKPNSTSYGYNKLEDKLYGPTDKELGNFFIYKKANNEYVYVGHKIYAFRSINNEKLIMSDTYGPISKDGTSYPYLITNNYTYFFREHVAVPNIVLGVKRYEGFEIGKDPYNLFYGDAAGWIRKKAINTATKEFKIKIIDDGLDGQTSA